MDWVRQQMQSDDTAAAERLFRKDAGLTERQRMGLAQELGRDFRRQHPHVLAGIILGLPPGEAADRLLWRFIADWSASDAEDALRFIEALPADRLNTTGVLTNAAFGLARLPADRVLAFAARLDDKGRSFLAEGLVAFADQAGSWRNTAAILSKLNATPQKEAISVEWQLGVKLAEIEPQLIESQIAAENDPLKRDELLGGYAWNVGLYDPPRGIELDAQIQRPEMGERNLDHHVVKWLESDRAAALSWLQGDVSETLIPAELRAKLLRSYGLEAAR